MSEETNEEFLKRMEFTCIGYNNMQLGDKQRLFALAARGAKIPDESTMPMIIAGQKAAYTWNGYGETADIYRAMLATALGKDTQ